VSNTAPNGHGNGNGLSQFRRDAWERYGVSLLGFALTAGIFYKGLTDAQEMMKSAVDKLTNQQQQIVNELQRLRLAGETLAEHVKSSDLRQADDHYRIQRIEEGKRP
jgi:hypothetical protein